MLKVDCMFACMSSNCRARAHTPGREKKGSRDGSQVYAFRRTKFIVGGPVRATATRGAGTPTTSASELIRSEAARASMLGYQSRVKMVMTIAAKYKWGDERPGNYMLIAGGTGAEVR